MIAEALRRLAILILAAVGLTVVGSLVLGALLGASPDRALTLGFYLSGCFMMIAGFFVANRGPARVKSEGEGGSTIFGYVGSRRIRWATLGEQNESINFSAVFITLGVVLVTIGLVIDTRHSLF
jgi:hypothetical protein